jgi:hypothetical protein
MSHLRIFPHSQNEFPCLDALQTWLMTALRAGGGEYLLRSRNSVADLPAGSIVLFRYGDELVGEAVVREYVRESQTARTFTGEERHYEARVSFAPSSIRMFSPPIPIEALKVLIRDSGDDKSLTGRNPYYEFTNWAIYPKLLAAHVGGEICEEGKVLWQRWQRHDRGGVFL